METINGYVVFANKSVGSDRRLILAARPDNYHPSGFEYVSAWVDAREEKPKQWYWGHYTHDLAEAMEDFEKRYAGG